jgi:hypothetical protein
MKWIQIEIEAGICVVIFGFDGCVDESRIAETMSPPTSLVQKTCQIL